MKVADWVPRWQCWCRDGVLGAVARAHFCLLEEGTHVYTRLGNRQQATVFFKAGQKCLHWKRKQGWSYEASQFRSTYLRILGGHLHGHSWTIQAPLLCKGPSLIFGVWAVNAHGALAQDNTVLTKVAFSGMWANEANAAEEKAVENGPTQSLVTQCSSLAVCKLNFVLQAKNAEDEATIGVCKPCRRM